MKRYSILALLYLLALQACEKINLFDGYISDKQILMNVSGGSKDVTKSGQPDASLSRIYDLGNNLLLKETVSEYPDYRDIATKGAIITDSGHNTINADSKTFKVEGWLGTDVRSADKSSDADKANQHFVSATATYSGSGWTLSGNNYWRNGITSSFWSYTQPTVGTLSFSWHGNTPTDAELETLPFTYILPAPTTDKTDAANLQDFVIAYNHEKRQVDNDGTMTMEFGTAKTSEKNDINLTFHHPLSAIKFKIGTISGDPTSSSGDHEGNEYVNITKVELVDVKTSGTFAAKGNGTNGCEIICNSSSGTATYSQAQPALRSDIADGKFENENSDFVFFMIPQSLSGVKIRLTMVRKKKTVTYESDGTTIHSVSYGDPIEFSRDVSLSGNWEPGKYYTYQINSTVYFGGEELTLPKDEIETSANVEISAEGSISFKASGKESMNEWVAPLPTSGVNVLKLTINHQYTNNSGKSVRKIWLENATVNPEYTGSGDTEHPHYINPDNIKTTDADLVNRAKTLTNATSYWPTEGGSVHYTGILGEVNNSLAPTAYDQNMNKKGNFTNIESTMYFFLGGKFENVKIHFDYEGSTGGGSAGWVVQLPTFNITEVAE